MLFFRPWKADLVTVVGKTQEKFLHFHRALGGSDCR